jgi:CubicO group peptidase (beta-lactamase class C family)
MDVLPGTAHRLLARTAEAQAGARLPSLVAGVVRAGGLAWHGGRGSVDGAAPTADTQYRIGSISKTFTALLVMRLRDEGRLALTDPLDAHLPGSPFGDRTVGQILAHGGGLQAETAGPWWERTAGAAWPETVAALDPQAAVPHAPGRRFHYSNLGYGALGALVARQRGRPWYEALRAEILEPLGLRRTSYRPAPPFAPGLAVHPWAEAVLPEPEHDAGALAPAGQLWSTLDDLGRLAAFLLGDAGDVLAPDTLAEMAQPALIDETPDGLSSYGLGLQVIYADGRRLVGHNGAMPGFVASVLVDADAGLGGAWAANTTYGGDRGLLAALLAIVRECEPAVAEEWRPAALPDGISLDLLGPWYWGPNAFALRARGDGLLELAPLGRPGRGSRFRPAGDAWIGLDGYFAGERLRIDPGGRSFELATFVFTRAPYDADAPIPGGVDPAGWSDG